METINNAGIITNRQYNLGKAAEKFAFLFLDEPASAGISEQQPAIKNRVPENRESNLAGYYSRPIFKLPKHDILL